MHDPGYAGNQAQRVREAVGLVQGLRFHCQLMKQEKIEQLGPSSVMLDDGKRVQSIPSPTLTRCVPPASDLF